MKKKQYIAAVICLVAGIVGFGSVYATRQVEKIKQESNQVAQGEDEKKQEQQGQAAEGQPDSRQSASNDSRSQTNDAAKPDDTAREEEEPAASASTVVPPKSNELPQGVIEMDVDTGIEEVPKEQEETQPTAVVEETLHFTQQNDMVWPLEGNVLLNYSMDSTIYFPTLDQYRYNPALVISGAVNDKVYLVADGIITDIYTNEETGCTVIQDLGDGYTAIYGQLKELNFEVGEHVQRGQVIGYVSEPTKYYSLEGSNLYFELQKDNEPVNPLDYFQ